jgi:SAM-dependent methyltransferase
MDLARAQELFDRLYNDVSGYEISRAEKKRLGREEDSTTYGEVVPASFHEMVSAVSPREGEVFMDLGSGTGKAPLLAAMLFPFRKVVGVELLPGLGDAARQVLGRYDAEIRPTLPPEHARQRIEFLDGDLGEVDVSEVDVVFAHATSFEPWLMEKLVGRLELLKPGARAIIVGHFLQSPELITLGRKVMKLSWGSNITGLYQRR